MLLEEVPVLKGVGTPSTLVPCGRITLQLGEDRQANS